VDIICSTCEEGQFGTEAYLIKTGELLFGSEGHSYVKPGWSFELGVTPLHQWSPDPRSLKRQSGERTYARGF